MKELRRSTWARALFTVLCAGLAAVALRAAAQSLMTGTPAPMRAAVPAAADPAAPSPASAGPATPAPATPAPPASSTPAPPLPSAGAIRDEPEVAPDKKESADNNVSFPVDI